MAGICGVYPQHVGSDSQVPGRGSESMILTLVAGVLFVAVVQYAAAVLIHVIWFDKPL
jgi:hypothetical protein